MLTPKTPTILLLVYGIGLWIIGFLIAGGGHGTYTLIGLAGSPFAILGKVGILVAPLQWCVLGLSISRKWMGRKTLIAFLLVHYAVAVVLLTWSDGPFADWEYAKHLNFAFFMSGFAFYALGQGYLWWIVAMDGTADRWR